MSKHNCYSCQRCISGTYQIDHNRVDEGTLICELTGNPLVDPFGKAINITPCRYYKEDLIPVLQNIEIQLPF